MEARGTPRPRMCGHLHTLILRGRVVGMRRLLFLPQGFFRCLRRRLRQGRLSLRMQIAAPKVRTTTRKRMCAPVCTGGRMDAHTTRWGSRRGSVVNEQTLSTPLQQTPPSYETVLTKGLRVRCCRRGGQLTSVGLLSLTLVILAGNKRNTATGTLDMST